MKKLTRIIAILLLLPLLGSCDLFTPPDYTVYLLNPYFKEKPDWLIDNTSPEYQDDDAEQTKEFYVEELGKTVTLNYKKTVDSFYSGVCDRYEFDDGALDVFCTVKREDGKIVKYYVYGKSYYDKDTNQVVKNEEEVTALAREFAQKSGWNVGKYEIECKKWETSYSFQFVQTVDDIKIALPIKLDFYENDFVSSFSGVDKLEQISKVRLPSAKKMETILANIDEFMKMLYTRDFYKYPIDYTYEIEDCSVVSTAENRCALEFGIGSEFRYIIPDKETYFAAEKNCLLIYLD